MRNLDFLKEIIDSRNAAIMCRNKEEVELLADMVEELFPTYGQKVKLHGSSVGGSRYGGQFCIRIDQHDTLTLTFGHSGAWWYRGQNKTIVTVEELLEGSIDVSDLGEIEIDLVDINDLLLGNIKA